MLLGGGLVPHRWLCHALARVMVWAPEVPPGPHPLARHGQAVVGHTQTHTDTHTCTVHPQYSDKLDNLSHSSST